MANFPVFNPDPRWFPMPTLQQGSPFGGVLADALAKRLSAANAQKAETEAEFAPRKELANVLYQEMINKYYPQDIQSQIGLRGAQANLASQHAKYYPQDIQSQVALRNAQAGLAGQQGSKINYELTHPELFFGGDEAKTIAGLKLLEEKGMIPKGTLSQLNQPTPSQVPSPQQNANNNLRNGIMTSLPNNQPSGTPFNTGNPTLDTILNKKYAAPAYQQAMTSGFNWVHLPAETKQQLIAQGYGMGVDPLKMMQYVNKGMGVQQIAQAEGLDPNNIPPPIYPPTAATKTRTQQVQQVGAELSYIESATTPIIARYADTFAGISGQKWSDMFSNDPEAQKRYGEYIGALSVQTGLASGRTLLEGGKPGLEVMRMVKNSALRGIDQNLKPLKNSKIAFESAQKTINEILHKGAKIRTTIGMNPMSEVGRSRLKAEENALGNNASTGKDTYSKWENGKLIRVNK